MGGTTKKLLQLDTTQAGYSVQLHPVYMSAGLYRSLPYLGVGYSIHDDDGVDVRLARRPFLENDAGDVRRVLGIAAAKHERTSRAKARARERR